MTLSYVEIRFFMSINDHYKTTMTFFMDCDVIHECELLLLRYYLGWLISCCGHESENLMVDLSRDSEP